MFFITTMGANPVCLFPKGKLPHDLVAIWTGTHFYSSPDADKTLKNYIK